VTGGGRGPVTDPPERHPSVHRAAVPAPETGCVAVSAPETGCVAVSAPETGCVAVSAPETGREADLPEAAG